jgi:UDP-N-acetyl-D-mannosaminuronate dehydrogenase
MSTSALRRVGIVGLGKMGHPMARHLARAKFEVTGYDIDAHARSQAQGSGIVLVDNPRAVAERSDFVIIVVGFDSEAEAVLLARDGIAGAGRRGLIVGIASTVAPSTMARLAARLADSGIPLSARRAANRRPRRGSCWSWSAAMPRLSSRASRRLRASPAASSISVSWGRGRSAKW